MEWNIPIYYRNPNYYISDRPDRVDKKCSTTVKQFIEICDKGLIRITKSEGWSESDVNDDEYTNPKWEDVLNK
jgi:hypothetical protein